MSPDEYLLKVINKKKSKQISWYDPRLTNIKSIIKRWAGTTLSSLKKSGSSAKGTALIGVSDFDLFISLKSSTPQTLSQIYDSLEIYVNRNGYRTRRQNVSLGIKCKDLDVDLVPGKIHSGYRNRHSLYSSKSGTWIQTDVDLHINNVINSGRLNEIIAIKIWRELNKLKFPSIYLEETVIQALKYKRKGNTADNFLTVLEFLKNDFLANRVVDPANTNNVISDQIYKYQKDEIRKAASTSLSQNNWKKIIR